MNEFKEETNGQQFYMYRTYRFMHFAETYLENEVDEKAIKEVKDVGESRSKNHSIQSVNYIDYLTEQEFSIYNNMISNAESEANSNKANHQLKKAMDWANLQGRLNFTKDQENRIFIRNNLAPYLSGLPPVQRDEVFSNLEKEKLIINDNKTRDILDDLIRLALSISGDLGY